MNKRGFTLIELLAVIVILAIIALIAVPIVLNMIENARKSAAKSSAYGYIEAIDNYNELAEMNGEIEGVPTTPIENGEHQVSEITINIKGKKPSSGKVVLTKGRVSSATDLCFNDYPVSYDGTEATVGAKGCSGGSTPEPEPVYNWDGCTTAESPGVISSPCPYPDWHDGDMYVRGDSVKKYGEVCMILDGNTVCAGPNSNGRENEFANAASGTVTGYTEEKRQEMLSKWDNVTCTVDQYKLRCTHPYEYSNQWEYYFLIKNNGQVECGLNDGNNNREYCDSASYLNSYTCCNDFNCQSLNYN